MWPQGKSDVSVILREISNFRLVAHQNNQFGSARNSLVEFLVAWQWVGVRGAERF